MSERNDALLVRLLRRLPRSEPGRTLRTACLEEETLASYLAGGLDEISRFNMERHLADCRFCLDELVAAHKAGLEDSKVAVPDKAIARAMALMANPKPQGEIFKLVVELVRDSLELISTSGRLVMPALAADVRGRGKSASAGILHIEKDLGKVHISVEVERLEGELCQVAVHASSNGGSAADGLRVSLMSGEREQASYLARQGRAVFDRIPPGEYRLAMAEAGRSLGVIELTIKEYGHGRERKTY